MTTPGESNSKRDRAKERVTGRLHISFMCVRQPRDHAKTHMEADMRKRTIATIAPAAALTLGVIGAVAYAESPPPSPSASPANPKNPQAPKSQNTETKEPSYT